MRNFFAVYKRELQAYFASPVAYAVMCVFALVCGFFFNQMVAYFARVSQSYAMSQGRYGMPDLNFTEYVLLPMFMNMSVIMMFFLPALTMRLFSEEKRQGTIELLFTYPIRDAELVLAKYAACVTMFICMLALTFINMLLLIKYGEPEKSVLISGYLGLLLMGGAFLAMGIFLSSLTENQVVAFFVGLGALLLLWVLVWAADAVPQNVGRVIQNLSIIPHYENFAKGVIQVKDVSYFVIFAVFFLFLTFRALETKKWRG